MPTIPPRPAKLRVIKVRPSCGGPWCVCDDWACVEQMVTEEGSYDVEIVDLTPEEYDAIPDDFPGW